MLYFKIEIDPLIFFYTLFKAIADFKIEFDPFKNGMTFSKALVEKEMLTGPQMRTRSTLSSLWSSPDTLFPNLKWPLYERSTLPVTAGEMSLRFALEPSVKRHTYLLIM